MTNKQHTTLYVGVTSDLIKRVYQHKQGEIEGFTKRYKCKKLVYFEQCEEITGAIEREKQIKAGSRKKKLELIITSNPDWLDLFETLQ